MSYLCLFLRILRTTNFPGVSYKLSIFRKREGNEINQKRVTTTSDNKFQKNTTRKKKNRREEKRKQHIVNHIREINQSINGSIGQLDTRVEYQDRVPGKEVFLFRGIK